MNVYEGRRKDKATVSVNMIPRQGGKSGKSRSFIVESDNIDILFALLMEAARNYKAPEGSPKLSVK